MTQKTQPLNTTTTTFRAIASHEETLSATEIVERFEALSGHSLHPTNAGNAAKALRLDYIEVQPEDASAVWKLEKRYSVLDIPLIFERLHALVANRAKYQ
jgi:hypothetical protein